jgi:pantoate--beta-alanine ligase
VHISTTIDELRLARSRLPNPVGFVPTMGYLHAGHTSLVRQAKVECASVVASIFVNPTQFGPQEDFAAYPRDLERDLALLEAAGCELVWTPTPEIMYPPGYQTWITLDEITQSLEGAKRPGHFRGVATVVAKLFIAVQPQRAYFGQKDAQQAAVIRRMARDLDFPIDVIACPTVREPDGLAMSSRNTYLNPAERQAAIVLYRSLQAAKALFIAGSHIHPNVGAIQKDGGGLRPGSTARADAQELRQTMLDVLAQDPLARVQYVSCADLDTLQEQQGPVDRALCSMAVYVGKTRLIDNMILSN